MTTKKVVIVTGASSGIGEATSRMLINGGAKVMLVARREDKLKKIAEELGEDAHYHVADVANHKEMLKMSEETLSLFGRVDVLVNNAGIMPLSLISSCLLYTSPSPRDGLLSRMPSSA